MGTTCQVAGCKNDSPSALAEQKLCVLHFTLSLETNCGEMRRETALGNAPAERQREIMRFITEQGERLARVATSGLHLTDDLKARILSTFLTLMNLRENLDRASMRSSLVPGILAEPGIPRAKRITRPDNGHKGSAPRQGPWCPSGWRGRPKKPSFRKARRESK